jgi:hypothetical protein
MPRRQQLLVEILLSLRHDFFMDCLMRNKSLQVGQQEDYYILTFVGMPLLYDNPE